MKSILLVALLGAAFVQVTVATEKAVKVKVDGYPAQQPVVQPVYTQQPVVQPVYSAQQPVAQKPVYVAVVQKEDKKSKFQEKIDEIKQKIEDKKFEMMCNKYENKVEKAHKKLMKAKDTLSKKIDFAAKMAEKDAKKKAVNVDMVNNGYGYVAVVSETPKYDDKDKMTFPEKLVAMEVKKVDKAADKYNQALEDYKPCQAAQSQPVYVPYVPTKPAYNAKPTYNAKPAYGKGY